MFNKLNDFLQSSLAKKIFFVLFFVFILLFPIVAIWGMLGLVDLAVEKCAVPNPLIYIDSTITASNLDVLNIYFSILGIEIGALLSYAIFRIELNRENEAEESARLYLYQELLTSLDYYFNMKFENITINNDWVRDNLKLTKYVKEDFTLLNEICSLMTHPDKSFGLDDFLYADFYNMLRNKLNREDINHVKDVLSDSVISLLNQLNPTKSKIDNMDVYYKNKEKFYTVTNEDNSKRYTVYNNEGIVIINCTFKNNKIDEGYGVIAESNTKYEGNFVNGKQEGVGKTYFLSTNVLIEDGKYKDGKIVEGMLNEVLCTEDGKVLTPIKHLPKNAIIKDLKEIRYIANFELKNGEYNIKGEVSPVMPYNATLDITKAMEALSKLQNASALAVRPIEYNIKK